MLPILRFIFNWVGLTEEGRRVFRLCSDEMYQCTIKSDVVDTGRIG